eukprot:TRINITY_DN26800_c0_g1_i1.p1 TRINITY_DN26800_c0_g1~~TRINITY_DN26800_c0_g1_i1.p1  ORF type:complete len:400 (+),score=26.91 TRINITY_DN26800_c0_g1_i1:47-1246(+)
MHWSNKLRGFARASPALSTMCWLMFAQETTLLSPTPFSFLFWTLLMAFYGVHFKNYRSHLSAQSEASLARKHFRFPRTSKEVRVLSYNIFLRPPFVKNNFDDLKNERLDAFFDEIHNFDIVILQECFQLANSRPQRLIQHAKKAGFAFHAMSAEPALLSVQFIDAGLLILSRYPIVEHDAFIYTAGNQIDAYAAKQIIHALIQLNDEHFVHVFTTHMQASYYDSSPEHNLRNDKARLHQVKEMALFVRRKCFDSPHPILIAGDLNIEAVGNGQESAEYQYLMHTLNTLATTSLHGPAIDILKQDYNGQHPTTYADVDPVDPCRPRETVLTHTADHCRQLCIDYMLFMEPHVNNGVRRKSGSTKVLEFFVAGKPFSQISDHYALSTTLLVTPDEPTARLT